MLIPLDHLSTSAGGGSTTRPSPHPGVSPSIRPWIRQWSRVRVLADIFEGAATPTVRRSTCNQAIELLTSYERFQLANLENWLPGVAQDFHADSPPEIPPADPDGLACARISFRGHTALVGAEAIMEALADLVEELTKTLQDRTIDPLSPLRNEGQFMFTLFLQLIGLPAAKVSDLATLKRVYFTLLVCLELALQTPVGFPYYKLRTSTMNFGDLHPGYRFIRASHLVRKFGLVENLQASQRGFQDSLCQTLGWPSPLQFEELAAILTGTDFFYIERHVHGIKHRADVTAPAAEADPERNPLDLPVVRAGGPFLLYKGQRKVVPLFKPDQKLINSLVMRVFLFKWAWTIMWEGNLDIYESFSDNGVPFGSLFGVADRDLVESYVQENPILSASNFILASHYNPDN